MGERKWISTTIKRKWLDKILSGEKNIEYKVASDFWNKRLEKYIGFHKPGELGINFLCGRESVKFEVVQVSRVLHTREDLFMDIDGVKVKQWFEINLGERIA